MSCSSKRGVSGSVGNGARAASAADQPGDGIRGLTDLEVCLGASLLHGLGHAVGQVFLKKLQREGLQGLRGRGDLSEDVDAVLVLLDHALQAPDLALDAAQSLEVTVLVLYVARCRVGRARRHVALTDLPLPRITRSMSRIPPSGMQEAAGPRGGGRAWY